MNKEHVDSWAGRLGSPAEGQDFAMEFRLKELDEDLHKRFTNSVFAIQYNLSNYKLLFPEYTDHTNLHSLTVIDFCNQLMGDNIRQLNADETYVLLMSCYFHDTGMGISMQDYELFSRDIDFGDYFASHSREAYPDIIRDFHHEFSGRFIHKYASFLEIPSKEHEWAIIQVSRGHRKTDLMDEKEYPSRLLLSNGRTVCLPYLAALIRLSDEIDVAAARNSILLYDIEALTDAIEIVENKKLKAVKRLDVSEKAFTLILEPTEPEIREQLFLLAGKMQKTLDYCRKVIAERTPYSITQERVDILEE